MRTWSCSISATIRGDRSSTYPGLHEWWAQVRKLAHGNISSIAGISIQVAWCQSWPFSYFTNQPLSPSYWLVCTHVCEYMCLSTHMKKIRCSPQSRKEFAYRPEAALFRRTFLQDWPLTDDRKLGSSNGLYLLRLVQSTWTAYANNIVYAQHLLSLLMEFWYLLERECRHGQPLIETVGTKSQMCFRGHLVPMGFFGPQTTYKRCYVFHCWG